MQIRQFGKGLILVCQVHPKQPYCLKQALTGTTKDVNLEGLHHGDLAGFWLKLSWN